MLNKSEHALFEFVTLRTCLNACQTSSLVFESVFNETGARGLHAAAGKGIAWSLRQSSGEHRKYLLNFR